MASDVVPDFHDRGESFGEVGDVPPSSGPLPTGTVTFLLTDIEGSTAAWERAPEATAAAVAEHYRLLDQAITAHSGQRPVEQGEGDSVVAVFTRGDRCRGRRCRGAAFVGRSRTGREDGGAHRRDRTARRGQLLRADGDPLRQVAGDRARRSGTGVGCNAAVDRWSIAGRLLVGRPRFTPPQGSRTCRACVAAVLPRGPC